MKKVVFILSTAMIVATATVSAQYGTTVSQTPHNLSVTGGGAYDGQVCIYCHTPHKSNTTVGALWNKAMPGIPTRNGAPIEYFNLESSGTCLSCHDGTIGVDSVLNFGGSPGEWAAGGGAGYTATWEMTASNPAYIGADLSDDHPIGEAYPTIAPATSTRWKSATPSTSGTSASVTVVGSSSSLRMPVKTGTPGTYTVECATCHTPHSNANHFFLRASNTASNLCLACHTR